jgi:uncharacterized protein (TIGR04222 family)
MDTARILEKMAQFPEAMIASPLARIPLLDWSGPEFLQFYIVALVVAAAWSGLRRRRALERYALPDAPALEDPYEIACLAGGGPRLVQLVVARLLDLKLIGWNRKFSGPRLVALPDSGTSGLSRPELDLLAAVRGAGAKGLKVRDSSAALGSAVQAAEVRLALRGLRPTADERSSARRRAVLPLVVLGVIGFVKLLIGLARERPVFFLLLLLILTLVIGVSLMNGGRLLTSTGEQALDRLRQRNRDLIRLRRTDLYQPSDLMLGVALFGPACLAGFQDFPVDARSLQSEFTGSAGGGGGGDGCGTTSSGCSSGGSSGGGGCGGCGGGD